MQEFKAFAIKGNVIDLAVGVIIGAAFGKIVGSVVKDLIMPIVDAVVRKLDFANLFLVLSEAPPGIVRTLDVLKKPAFRFWLTATLLLLLLIFSSWHSFLS